MNHGQPNAWGQGDSLEMLVPDDVPWRILCWQPSYMICDPKLCVLVIVCVGAEHAELCGSGDVSID